MFDHDIVEVRDAFLANRYFPRHDEPAYRFNVDKAHAGQFYYLGIFAQVKITLVNSMFCRVKLGFDVKFIQLKRLRRMGDESLFIFLTQKRPVNNGGFEIRN